MRYFDAHCHLTDPKLAGQCGEVLARARAAGVERAVTIASNPEDARAAIAIATSDPDVWATVGLHPHEAQHDSAEMRARIRELAAHPRVVALGETGLDFYYDSSPRAEQRAAFEFHLELGVELGLPIVVHAREADDDVAALIAAAGRARGVLHCFAGGDALLRSGLAAGWMVSFSGLVTFRNYTGQDLVREVPDERLLIETDSPYLAPVPMRGRTNEPAFVTHVCDAVARIRGQDPEHVAAVTFANACAFYGLRAPDSPRA